MKLITTLIALLAVYELAFGKENSKTVTKLFDKENKCIMDRKKGLCNNELGNSGNIERKLKSFGPKFQKVHLQLPRINPIRVSTPGYLKASKSSRIVAINWYVCIIIPHAVVYFSCRRDM